MLRRLRQTSSDTKLLREKGYRLIKEIGEGAHARVYLGEFGVEAGDSFRLACKVINITDAPRRYVQKFLPRELGILVRLRHPYIVHIYSIFQRKTSFFIFMRYAENGDLFEYIKLKGLLKENHARVWVRQIALALQYLHTLQIAHRDLKCENILVTAHLNLKLTDFGFARAVVDETGEEEWSETYCGSKQYVAPEILRGIPYNPKAADMWSFGIVIYTMLNKALPFNERDKRTLYFAQMQKQWRFRNRVVDTLSNEVKQLVIGLINPDPSKRKTIGEVVNSDWIAMDPRLRKLTTAENNALFAALEEMKSCGGKTYQSATGKRATSNTFKRQSKDVVYWKQMATGLEVDASFLNRLDDIVLNERRTHHI